MHTQLGHPARVTMSQLTPPVLRETGNACTRNEPFSIYRLRNLHLHQLCFLHLPGICMSFVKYIPCCGAGEAKAHLVTVVDAQCIC